MTATNDHRYQQRLDALARLEGIALGKDHPRLRERLLLFEAMLLSRALKRPDPADVSDQITCLVGLWRLCVLARALQPAKAYFFRLLAGWLTFHSQILMNQEQYLGPLWKRREAIRQENDWPEEDENGDPWSPEEHLEKVPEAYTAWADEFERSYPQMERAAFRAVCQAHGIPEIADLRETNLPEYHRRFQAGQESVNNLPGAATPPRGL